MYSTALADWAKHKVNRKEPPSGFEPSSSSPFFVVITITLDATTNHGTWHVYDCKCVLKRLSLGGGVIKLSDKYIAHISTQMLADIHTCMRKHKSEFL